ncbi:MAG: sugar phosphate nucleotidyltransferase [Lachnospiraceae bacterium]
MKVVILAGGLPSNISDEDDRIPKPMVNIGERPILWHIMKLYSHYGFNDFIICTGYRGDLIKHYFLDYYIYRSDITVDLEKNDVTIHNNRTEPWNVTVVHTGLKTATAKRIEKVLPYIEEEEFIVSYGDCISNLNIREMVKVHQKAKRLLTVAVAKSTGRNEILSIDSTGELITPEDSPQNTNSWVNACSMVVNKKVFENIVVKEQDRFEIDTLRMMSQRKEVITYKHNGFWLPVETMRDKLLLQSMWDDNKIPWKVWSD